MRFVTDDVSARELSSSGLKVIAAGLSRCATSSLQSALENDLDLGGPCMHMAYVAPHSKMLKLCCDAMLEQDKKRRQKLLHTIFDGYAASADFPGILFVEDLVEMYPDARLILNTRGDGPAAGQQWFESIKATIAYFASNTYRYATWLIPTDYWHSEVHAAGTVLWDRRFPGATLWSVETYTMHNNYVRDIAARHNKDLLVWQAQDGWAPICRFLGRPVPKKPFPHVNDRAFMRKLIWVLTIRGILAWGLLALTPYLTWKMWRWWNV